MEWLDNFIQRWEAMLNSDEELQLRTRDDASTLEGKTAIQLRIEGAGHVAVNVKDGKLEINKNTSQSPLLCWNVPLALFKEVLLDKQPVLYALLDERGSLSFDTHNFTHFDGASIIEMLYLAQEVVKGDAQLQQLFYQLGG